MCGIFGIINKKKAPFDRTAFNLMGIWNDTRGGDSCGIFIDNQVEYGVGQMKKYRDFFINSELIAKTTKCIAALGHCRKASVGAINAENAHPIQVIEDGKVVFTLIHNGTLYNHDELAKKYLKDVDVKGFTDSKILAYILSKKEYGVLADYIGGTAFCAYDHRDNCYYFYKGASKKYQTDKSSVVERPLYCIQEENRFIFSSIEESLNAVSREDVRIFEDNTIYKLDHKGNLTILRNIDRSSKYQYKPVTNYANSAVGYYGGTYQNSYNNYGGYYADEDDVYDNYYLCKISRCNFANSPKVGLYLINGKEAHGEYKVSAYGYESPKYGEPLYFWEGRLVYNQECLDFLELLYECVCRGTDGITLKDFTKALNFLSVFPYKKEDGFWYVMPKYGEEQRFTVNIAELFTDSVISYAQGLETIKRTGPTTTQKQFDALVKSLKTFVVDETELFNFILEPKYNDN